MSGWGGNSQSARLGPRTLAQVRTQTAIVDYALQRRALLRDVYRGHVGVYEVCDASPYLLRAAQYFGERTAVRCPICRRENVWRVHYVYGDRLKTSAGQARKSAELSSLAATVGECDVYVVEVCRGCSWNHLLQKFTLVQDGSASDNTGISGIQ